MAVPLGKLVITPAAKECLSPEAIRAGLACFTLGDWGDVYPEDAKANDIALANNGMLLGSYQIDGSPVFWIVSDPGRERTTVLMPKDY